jgi:hypothetical protein
MFLHDTSQHISTIDHSQVICIWQSVGQKSGICPICCRHIWGVWIYVVPFYLFCHSVMMTRFFSALPGEDVTLKQPIVCFYWNYAIRSVQNTIVLTHTCVFLERRKSNGEGAWRADNISVSAHDTSTQVLCSTQFSQLKAGTEPL